METPTSYLETPFFLFGVLCLILLVFLRTVPLVLYKLRCLLKQVHSKIVNYTPITYMKDDLLTHVSRRRLAMVRRKTLVLDMDETLISSVIIYYTRSEAEDDRNRAKACLVSTVPCDYSFNMPMSGARVFVYKRPYVDFFLDRVSQWYNLVVFTAAAEPYAKRVLDYLDRGRNILCRRMYRQNCINICGIRAKFVSIAHNDLSNVLLLDDCHMENSFNVGNAVRIKSFCIGSKDDELLCMLPFLDALRFTQDVRSILGRSTRYDCLTTCLAANKLNQDPIGLFT